MIHPNPPADGLHQTTPTTHTLIHNGWPTHTIRITWHEGERHVHVETHNQPPGGHMNIPLPRFLQQHQHHRQHATALATTIADTTLDLRDRVIVRDPSDALTLRGIPAVGFSVSGAIFGSVPHSDQTVNRLDKHRG